MLKPFHSDRMKAMRDPCCKMNRWLYGEQGAGPNWGLWFEKKLKQQGWTQICSSGGETIYIRDDVVLSVYVDDGCAAGKCSLILGLLQEVAIFVDIKAPSGSPSS